MKLETKATSMSLPTHVVLDAGRTQVAPGSATVLAIIGIIIINYYLLFIIISVNLFIITYC